MSALDSLGKRLKYVRERNGIKQNFAAKKIGVAPSTLANYENDFREPDADTLTQLAEMYDVTIDWLFGRSEPVKEAPNPEKSITLEEFKKIVESGAPLSEGEPMDEVKRKQLLTLLDMFIEQDKQK